jgi:hypothetical protein
MNVARVSFVAVSVLVVCVAILKLSGLMFAS